MPQEKHIVLKVYHDVESGDYHAVRAGGIYALPDAAIRLVLEYLARDLWRLRQVDRRFRTLATALLLSSPNVDPKLQAALLQCWTDSISLPAFIAPRAAEDVTLVPELKKLIDHPEFAISTRIHILCILTRVSPDPAVSEQFYRLFNRYVVDTAAHRGTIGHQRLVFNPREPDGFIRRALEHACRDQREARRAAHFHAFDTRLLRDEENRRRPAAGQVALNALLAGDQHEAEVCVRARAIKLHARVPTSPGDRQVLIKTAVNMDNALSGTDSEKRKRCWEVIRALINSDIAVICEELNAAIITALGKYDDRCLQALKTVEVMARVMGRVDGEIFAAIDAIIDEGHWNEFPEGHIQVLKSLEVLTPYLSEAQQNTALSYLSGNLRYDHSALLPAKICRTLAALELPALREKIISLCLFVFLCVEDDTIPKALIDTIGYFISTGLLRCGLVEGEVFLFDGLNPMSETPYPRVSYSSRGIRQLRDMPVRSDCMQVVLFSELKAAVLSKKPESEEAAAEPGSAPAPAPEM
ncbi:MAG: hypothetical protein K0U23_08185 [Gammaproteobacteria bacterium]|nr:hypothetical protein [Gammaproteobacteria bacterium]